MAGTISHFHLIIVKCEEHLGSHFSVTNLLRRKADLFPWKLSVIFTIIGLEKVNTLLLSIICLEGFVDLTFLRRILAIFQ